MSYKTIILEKKGHIATATLNRPERLNAENEQMLADLQEAWRELDLDDEIRVVVLTGAGRAFCSGGDVKDSLAPAADDSERRRSLFWARFREVPDHNQDMMRLTKPIIASINGLALGVGVTFALKCDMRIASESATFTPGQYTRMGLPPRSLLYLLPRAIGMGRACDLMFTGRTIDAQEALRIGLVDQVVPADELATATYEKARCVAELPPLAIRIIKRNLYMMRDTTVDVARHIDNFSFSQAMQTDDFAEATRAFREKRKPVFKGR